MTSSNPNGASNPQIPLVRVPIAELRQDPHNARSHDRRNLDAIKASLAKFGQVLPVVVRAGQIVGGNATTIAADELGWTHLDVTPADHLSPEEAVALAVALNRTAELASWDAGVLVDALQGLPTLEGTGFTAEELADLEAALNPPSLDELGSRYGEPVADDFWPTIQVKVPPDVHERYGALMGRLDGEGEAGRFAVLLATAEQALT